MAAISTAVSDAALAACSFVAAYTLRTADSHLATFGMLIFGFAASMGVFRFATNQPSDRLVENHKLLSWLGNLCGVPFLASALLLHNGHKSIGEFLPIQAVFLLCMFKVLTNSLKEFVNSLSSPVAIIAVIISSAISYNTFGCMFGAGVVVAGLLIGADGYLLGIPRVDLFHYALAVNQFIYIMALGLNPL